MAPDNTDGSGIGTTGARPRLLTPHQSQYMAWLLTRRAAGDTVESLASTLVDAQVDLNPHQVEAALFACRNPLSRGVILADEVGLGKTIEAGLVISQRWAERRRKMLIIVPANLRKQWHQKQRELEGRRSKLRRELFARQDEVETQRDDLIGQLEAQLQQQVEERTLFSIEWGLR